MGQDRESYTDTQDRESYVPDRERFYALCQFCDHFVDLNPAAEERPELARYIHLSDGEKGHDHNAAPSDEMHRLETWRELRPDLFKKYPDGKIGPNSEFHSPPDNGTDFPRDHVKSLRKMEKHLLEIHADMVEIYGGHSEGRRHNENVLLAARSRIQEVRRNIENLHTDFHAGE